MYMYTTVSTVYTRHANASLFYIRRGRRPHGHASCAAPSMHRQAFAFHRAPPLRQQQLQWSSSLCAAQARLRSNRVAYAHTAHCSKRCSLPWRIEASDKGGRRVAPFASCLLDLKKGCAPGCPPQLHAPCAAASAACVRARKCITPRLDFAVLGGGVEH